MCGRYVLFTSVEDVVEAFHVDHAAFAFGPSFNIAPASVQPVVMNERGTVLVPARWGLVPPWSKDPVNDAGLINARAESVAEKPSFRQAFTQQRCIVPANGFFEWRKIGRKKQPVYLRRKHGVLMGMAGICTTWPSLEDGNVFRTFAIITTEPNELVRPIHDRMPAILHPEAYGAWLDPGFSRHPDRLAAMLQPYAVSDMEAYDVSPRVNTPGNDSAENVEPLTGLPGL